MGTLYIMSIDIMVYGPTLSTENSPVMFSGLLRNDVGYPSRPHERPPTNLTGSTGLKRPHFVRFCDVDVPWKELPYARLARERR